MLDISLASLLSRAIALLLGFSVHEAAHAWVAYRLGDDTAARAGRLTLNPLKHLDPLGSLLVLVAMIGWAKPVPVSPWRLRYGPRVGFAMVSVAGPLSNLVLAALAAIPWRLGWLDSAPELVLDIFWAVIALNVVLFIFNLLPLAPLDGIKVLSGLVGERADAWLRPLQAYGPQILLGLVMIGFVIPRLDLLSLALYPVMSWVVGLLVGG